eukprot:COSAG06_NODE_4730_length_3996_cov_6.916603_5_plen_94_part_00
MLRYVKTKRKRNQFLSCYPITSRHALPTPARHCLRIKSLHSSHLLSLDPRRLNPCSHVAHSGPSWWFGQSSISSSTSSSAPAESLISGQSSFS